MAYYPKKPRLTHDEVIREIANRTGIAINTIYRALWTYNEIAKEALMENVEIPLGDIGFLSWKFCMPHEQRVNKQIGVKNGEQELRHFAGHQKTSLRVNAKWAQELKELTKFDFDMEEEENEGT